MNAFRSNVCHQSCMSQAVVRGRGDMLESLVQDGGNINSVDSTGTSLVSLAVHHKKFDIMHWLVEKGADLNQTNYCGWSALHFACNGAPLTGLVEHLIAHGAHIDLVANNKRTPLDMLFPRYNEKQIEYLLWLRRRYIRKKWYRVCRRIIIINVFTKTLWKVLYAPGTGIGFKRARDHFMDNRKRIRTS